MRIVKEAEIRRNEILDAAYELFSKKGFDKTSTNDILEKVGIARGTLYYHFKSKEDIMDSLIKRYCLQILDLARSIASDKEISIDERLVRIILALNIKYKKKKKFEYIHKPQNALMHHKMQKSIIKKCMPIFLDVVTEGINEEIFKTPYPRDCIQMIMAYIGILFDDDMVMTEEEYKSCLKALLYNMERLLGAECGSLMKYI